MIECVISRAFYRGNKSDETDVLRDIDISISDGACASVIGPSGCGKSTLLKIMAGLHHGYNGTATGLGRVGYMPQNGGLLPWKTVLQNTVSLRAALGVAYTDAEALALLDSLGIRGHANKYPSRISGGQAQRAALARAFFMKPDTLLMDEPFSALDEATREEMWRVFLDMRKEHGISAVFITHSIEEALVLGDEVYVLSHTPGTVKATLKNQAGRARDADFYVGAARLRSVIGRENA